MNHLKMSIPKRIIWKYQFQKGTSEKDKSETKLVLEGRIWAKDNSEKDTSENDNNGKDKSEKGHLRKGNSEEDKSITEM